MLVNHLKLQSLPAVREMAHKGLLIIVSLWLTIGFLSWTSAVEAAICSPPVSWKIVVNQQSNGAITPAGDISGEL